MKSLHAWGMPVLVAALIVAGWELPGGSALALLGQFLAFWLACRSWQWLAAQAGLFSFGHAIFIGAGAFAAVWAMRALAGAPALWLAFVPFAAALAGAAAAGLVAAVSARSRGTAFAMITFGLGELVYLLAQAMPAVFGGEAGIGADRGLGHALRGGPDFAAAQPLHALIVAWACAVIALLGALERTAFADAMRLVRDHPVRAQALGLDPVRVRAQAIVLAGAAAAVAGALLALQFELASVEAFASQRSLALMIAVLIGGVATPAGAALGAAVHVGFTHVLALRLPSWQLWYGAVFLLAVLWQPAGAVELLARLARRRAQAKP